MKHLSSSVEQQNQEQQQMIQWRRDKGIDVEYMLFEDEGHGFTKYSNLVKALKRSAEFLVEKLL